MLDGERRLWGAVLTQAIYDLMDNSKSGCHPFNLSRLRYFAELWFLSDNYSPGSFRWICDQFELDASWLKRRLFPLAVNNSLVRKPRQAVTIQPVTIGFSPGG